MKKIVISTLFIAIVAMCNVTAQNLMLPVPKDNSKPKNYTPISGDRSYSAIINTKQNIKDLVKNCKAFFIEEGLLEKIDNVINIDENLSEFKAGFSIRHGLAKAKGLMGLAYVQPPVILYFDIICEMNSEGQMRVTFANFDSDVYVPADENKMLNSWKGDEDTSFGPIKYDIDKKISDEVAVIMQTETGIGKMMMKLNGSKGLFEKVNRGELRKSLKEQFKVYDEALRSGSYEIINKENLDSYQMSKVKKNIWSQIVGKYRNNDLVMAVDNYRWKNFFEPNMNYFFKQIAENVNGEIESITLNEDILYKRENEKLLPTNKKMRKKWLKHNIIF